MFVRLCPVPFSPTIVILLTVVSKDLPLTFTVNVPFCIFCCAIGAVEPVRSIHESSPFPEPSGAITGIFRGNILGAVILGVIGANDIGTGNVGFTALLGNNVKGCILTTLGVIAALAS